MKNIKKKIFISTAIPYVNSVPHAGHALEYVQADAYARAQRLKGEDVYFLTGTDDNALKNVQSAEKAGIPVQEFVNKNAESFIRLDTELNISYDYFIRTSIDQKHKKGAQKLWKSCDPDDIYKKKYKGWYCVGCEEFKTEKEIINGECEEHPGVLLEEVEEENYFFRLSRYQQQLEEILSTDKVSIIPTSRKNEMLAFVRGGLEDFSISRSVARAKGWGIPVPDDPSQIQYVWYDALSNYINALGYAEDSETYMKFWEHSDERVHVIGKGINRFHSIYWIAILLSAKITLPTTIFVHGYITSNGQKMSKSIGNVVDPIDLINTYGSDAVRYFFLRHGSSTEDFDLTADAFENAYTANLVNGLGNLVARVMKLAETHLSEPIARPTVSPFTPEYWDSLNKFEFNHAIDMVFARIQALDERITREEPFKVVKQDVEKGKAIIAELATDLYQIGRLINPFMPQTSELVKKTVLENKKPENLFPRLS